MSARKWLPGRRTIAAGLIGLVVGLLIAGTTWWFVEARKSDQAAAGPTTTTRSVAAAVDTIKKSISTTGTLTPAVQQDVSFVASGTVTDVSVSQGQQVSAGQAMATVDTLTMQQALAQSNLTLAKAQATLVSDQSALSTAQDALTTAQDDGDDTTAAQAKVDTAQEQLNVDQTSIASAQSAVDSAQTAFELRHSHLADRRGGGPGQRRGRQEGHRHHRIGDVAGFDGQHHWRRDNRSRFRFRWVRCRQWIIRQHGFGGRIGQFEFRFELRQRLS